MTATSDDALERLAAASEGRFSRRRRAMEDFRYDEQQEKFWDCTTGNLLGAKSVDGAIHPDDWPSKLDGRDGKPIPLRPSIAINSIDTGLTVEGATWWPGKPKFIENCVITDRGALEVQGAVCYNSYIPPAKLRMVPGVTPQRWLDHIALLFPDAMERAHFCDFCAHMVQKPHEKVNHGLVIAGPQGIGKDTALLPVRAGCGEWNAAEIGPDAITSPYNGYLRSVLLVINEVRPQEEEFKASNFYNLLKPLLASPPEMLPMTLKYANTIYVRNLCHIILTTNDPLTLFIPPEDRRLFVMISPLQEGRLGPDYFDSLHEYLATGGTASVVDWLSRRDISEFNSKQPPPMTTGKRQIIEAANYSRRTLVDDVLELYIEKVFGGNRPDVIFHQDLVQAVLNLTFFDDASSAIKALNSKGFHFKMDMRGYAMVRNPNADRWSCKEFRSRAAFVAKSVPPERRIALVEGELQRRPLSFG